MARFTCDVCSRKYGHRSALVRHQREKHNLFSYNCDQCGYGCNMKTVFIKHIGLEHNFVNNETKKKYQKRLLCPCCKHYMKNYKELDSHLSVQHHVHTEKEQFIFNDMNQFWNWKQKIEHENKCLHVVCMAARKIKKKKCVRKEYYCHRSYTKRSMSEECKRSMKSPGTNKIGVICPSRIVIDIVGKQIETTFIRKHVRHSCEVIQNKISKDERLEMAGKLKQGDTIEQILRDIRDSEDTNNFTPIHDSKKKDLHNIQSDFKIGTTRFHSDNTDILINKLCVQEDSSVMYHVNSDKKVSRPKNSQDIEGMKDKLKMLMSYIENPSNECDTENINKCLDKAISFFKPTLNKNIKSAENNPLKYISHQIREGPKIQKTRTIQLLPRPTATEKNSCIRTHKGDDFIENIHTNFDHTSI